MDNQKIGSFIRTLRHEHGMTQNDLAKVLGITDRAISKWERGLCTPDIALLEPLTEALGISVMELLRGERIASQPEAEQQTQAVLDYSRQQLTQQVGAVRRRYLLAASAVLLAVALAAMVILWRGGWLYVVAREPSPNGADVLTVYNRQLDSGFTLAHGTSFILRYADGASLRVNYGDCRFGGAWWSPDGAQLVMQMHYQEETRLALLADSHINLNFFLTDAARQAGLVDKDGEEPEFRFLQWSADGSAMLISYTCGEQSGTENRGYFWFHVAQGRVDGVLQLDSAA